MGVIDILIVCISIITLITAYLTATLMLEAAKDNDEQSES